ncbi:ROK family protein [Actinomadura luteofluorescens]|uniref:ROK family protein n=1 Tax=Actinomadura luteofluorescens TaxID=46163 RepID=UPI00363490E9
MEPMTAHSARALRSQGALAVLRHVHAHPSAKRADAARALGMSSGSATEITSRLKASRLIDEEAAALTGGRGRPSPALVPHRDGPLVCVVDISHERWRVACVELGGRVVTQETGGHSGTPDVLGTLGHRVSVLHARYGHRLRAVSACVAGTVSATTVVQASGMGWRDVDLDPLRPPGIPLLVGNDASLAGLAEARRGAGAGTRVVLHLTVEVGVGGILVVDGRPVDGATGAGGEFGHMPFGDPSLHCPCGARGCWDLEVDGRAMARALGRPAPRDPRTAAGHVIAAAASDPAARSAAGAAARAGTGHRRPRQRPRPRGRHALRPGHRPGRDGARGPRNRLHGRPDALPPRGTAAHPALDARPAGPLTGAADAAFDLLLTEEGLAAWTRT